MTTALASMPATPELLAAVAKLPPITDVPDVDERAAAAPDPHFTLKKLLRPLVRPLLFAFVLVALDAVATLAIPLLIRTGVNEGVSKHAVHVIWLVSVIALVIVFVDWAINWQQTRVTMRTGERFLYTLRLKTFAHLQRLGLDYYEKEMSGRIMTRMTTDVDAFSTFLQTGLTTTAVSLLTFVGILVALLYLNLQLGLVIVAVLPIMIVATLIFRNKSSKAYTEAREKVSIVNADLQENVAGMRVAQAYRREQHNAARFAGRSDAYRVSRMRAQRYIATYFPFVQLLSDVASAVRADRRRVARQQQRADRRRADRLPALHRHVLRADPAAVAGVRRLSAGDGRSGADPRPAADADVDAAGGPTGHRARRLAPARRDRLRRRALPVRAGHRRGAARHHAARPGRARHWHWSGRPAPASRRSSSSYPGSTT